VALRFHHSCLYMRLLREQKAVNFHPRYRLPEADFAASGGGVPLFVRNVGIVGAAAVSGLLMSRITASLWLRSRRSA